MWIGEEARDGATFGKLKVVLLEHRHLVERINLGEFSTVLFFATQADGADLEEQAINTELHESKHKSYVEIDVQVASNQ